MKALFLDIDGVLNNSRSTIVKIGAELRTTEQREALNKLARHETIPYGADFALKCVDPVCVALVNKLLEESGARLILSSTHRKHFNSNLECLALFLKALGLKFAEHCFDITPSLHRPRGEEVAEWMNQHGEPEAYVILDDGTDFMTHQNLVWCDPGAGFDFENYVDACKFLGAREPGLILI